MSVKIMGLVWDLDLPCPEKLVLLAYTDHADHDGCNIYPAIKTIAKKTGYSERSVQVITRKLVKEGYLIPDGKGAKGTNKWKFGVGAESAGVQNEAAGGAENTGGGCSPLHQGGEVATAPEPSLTITEPSIKEINFSIMQEIADITHIDLKLNDGRIGKLAQKLIKAGYNKEDLKRFNDWWYENDWRGQKKQAPNLANIIEHIGKIKKTDQPDLKIIIHEDGRINI